MNSHKWLGNRHQKETEAYGPKLFENKMELLVPPNNS